MTPLQRTVFLAAEYVFAQLTDASDEYAAQMFLFYELSANRTLSVQREVPLILPFTPSVGPTVNCSTMKADLLVTCHETEEKVLIELKSIQTNSTKAFFQAHTYLVALQRSGTAVASVVVINFNKVSATFKDTKQSCLVQRSTYWPAPQEIIESSDWSLSQANRGQAVFFLIGKPSAANTLDWQSVTR